VKTALIYYAGSVCCRSNAKATGWGHSAMRLTSRVFSALSNVGGSFLTIEDGVLSSASEQHTKKITDDNGSELAEDAALRIETEQLSQETNGDVEAIPVVKLEAANVMPVQVNSVQDNASQQSSSSVCSQSSADIALSSLSALSEFDDQTMEEMNDEDDDIVFSSGTRRRVRRTKQPKGDKSL